MRLADHSSGAPKSPVQVRTELDASSSAGRQRARAKPRTRPTLAALSYALAGRALAQAGEADDSTESSLPRRRDAPAAIVVLRAACRSGWPAREITVQDQAARPMYAEAPARKLDP